MEIQSIYKTIVDSDYNSTLGLQIQSHSQDKVKAKKYRDRSRCFWGMTAVSLGLVCVVLLVFITLQHFIITAERNLVEKKFEELKDNISSLQHDNTDLKTEQQQLNNTIRSLSLEKLKLETRITTWDELMKLYAKQDWFFTDALDWFGSRQYCKDRAADLVVIKSEVKQRFVSSLVKERMWIGLSDMQSEGNMIWVDNSTLIQEFWHKGEPNDNVGQEDCIELLPTQPALNNWNDMPCSMKIRGICEK